MATNGAFCFHNLPSIAAEMSQNPYESPGCDSKNHPKDVFDSVNPLRGLIVAPITAGAVATALILAQTAVIAISGGSDNPAGILFILPVAIVGVPSVAGLGALVLGVPLVMVLKRLGVLTPSWVLSVGAFVAGLVAIATATFVARTSEYHPGETNLTNLLLGSMIAGVVVVGLPCFSCFVGYAIWLGRNSRRN